MKEISMSLCMIVKNEEETLERCLKSAETLADEIIIVDTGSTDSTKEIANKFGAKIYDFKWIDDFSAARNFAFSKATKEYIFWLDADDYISEDDIEKILQLKKELNKNIDYISMNYSLSRDENGKTLCSLRRNRIVKKSKHYKWIGRIHEYLEVYGNGINSDITINHGKIKEHTNRNLEVFRDMEKNKETFSTRDTFYYGNELYYNGFFEDAIKQYERFLDSKQGWSEDVKTATANIIQCYTSVGKPEKKIGVILKSFEVDKPRADICCRLAETFIEKGNYKAAIFWYKVAMGCTHDKDNLGIDVKDYYTWIPSIQLCVCYSNLGDFESAYYYNELTAMYIKDTTKVEYNRKFLRSKFKELGITEPELDIRLLDRRHRYF